MSAEIENASSLFACCCLKKAEMCSLPSSGCEGLPEQVQGQISVLREAKSAGFQYTEHSSFPSDFGGSQTLRFPHVTEPGCSCTQNWKPACQNLLNWCSSLLPQWPGDTVPTHPIGHPNCRKRELGKACQVPFGKMCLSRDYRMMGRWFPNE